MLDLWWNHHFLILFHLRVPWSYAACPCLFKQADNLVCGIFLFTILVDFLLNAIIFRVILISAFFDKSSYGYYEKFSSLSYRIAVSCYKSCKIEHLLILLDQKNFRLLLQCNSCNTHKIKNHMLIFTNSSKQ